MKLAISNIAWPPSDRIQAYQLMQNHDVCGLEIAPGLFLDGQGGADTITDAALKDAVGETTDFGLELVSMQSLLFGVQGAALFGDDNQVARFKQAIGNALRLAGRLGIPNCVMGSPGARVIPDGMPHDEANDRAAAVFRILGDVALANATRLALEPNPARYGTNFMTHTAQTHAMVKQTAHPAITLNFDIGALHANDEFGALESQLAMMLPEISHIHVSECDLSAAPRDAAVAEAIATVLSRSAYQEWISIEMRAVAGDELFAVDTALGLLTHAFGKR